MENGGLSLYDLIDDNAGFNANASQSVTLRLALALKHCLAQGVAHRDLKPENILVRTEMNEKMERVVSAVKLCDFGLCAIAPVLPSSEWPVQQNNAGEDALLASTPTSVFELDDGEMATRTFSRSRDDDEDVPPHKRNWNLSDFSGSPGFIAPEIVTQDVYNGQFTDIFSLGCVLLELVLGHAKFDEIWMRPFAPEFMADGAVFTPALHCALAQLRKLPHFSRPNAPLDGSDDGDVDGSSQQSTSTAVGDLTFGLLEVDPKNRIQIGAVVQHRWLRSAAKALAEPVRKETGEPLAAALAARAAF